MTLCSSLCGQGHEFSVEPSAEVEGKVMDLLLILYFSSQFLTIDLTIFAQEIGKPDFLRVYTEIIPI